MRKYFLTFVIGLVATTCCLAQDMGVNYFKTGEYETAQAVFQKRLAQEPALANYYLGEIAYRTGDKAKAEAYFQAGIQADAEYPFNHVGLGKILLASNAKGAEASFSTALKGNKKNVDVLIAIADAYYVNGQNDKMQDRLNDAIKADRESPLVYEFQGDMLKDAKDPGAAAGFYEQAIHFDPNYASPYVKYAQVYAGINAPLAVERLNKVLEVYPDYTLAYKYLADISYRVGRYNEAIAAYEIFFDKGDYSLDDLTRYAASLFFKDRFEEASALIQEGIEKDPNNFVLNRLLMYSAVETKDYDKGLLQARKFFALDKGDSEYIARDYMNYGKLLAKAGLFDDAVAQYELALELDPTQYAIYKEVAETFAGAGSSAMGADYYKKYIDAAGENAEALDFFNMGRYYYAAAGKALADTINVEAPQEAQQHLVNADSAFLVVSERIPDSHLGFIFRARTNSLQDPTADLGLARPHYEKTLEILLAKDDVAANKREILEVYKYLSYYHYVQFDKNKLPEDKEKSIEYSEKMLELDPGNAVATQLIDALK